MWKWTGDPDPTHTDLWRRQSTGPQRAVREHPPDILCATLTIRWGSVSAPVASAEHLPGGVGDLWPHEQATLLGFTLRTPAGRTGIKQGTFTPGFKHWNTARMSVIKNSAFSVSESYAHYIQYYSFQFLFHMMLLRQVIVFTGVDLRAVIFLFLHAVGTKTWLVQQSFQQVLHGWVPRCVVAVNIKPEVRKLVKMTSKRDQVKTTTSYFISVCSWLPMTEWWSTLLQCCYCQPCLST